MLEIFHSWRRKVGCVTLVMAIICWGAWLRSHVIVDQLSILTSKSKVVAMQSVKCNLIWFSTANDTGLFTRQPPFEWISTPFNSKGHIQPGAASVKWRFQWLGIGRGTSGNEDLSAELWIISDWYFLTPLTLLSAYLLLWKPRKRTGADHG